MAQVTIPKSLKWGARKDTVHNCRVYVLTDGTLFIVREGGVFLVQQHPDFTYTATQFAGYISNLNVRERFQIINYKSYNRTSGRTTYTVNCGHFNG